MDSNIQYCRGRLIMTKAEIEFGKKGYRRAENKEMIVYFKPYPKEDIRYDDITFCKRTKKIVFYQGSNLGSDAYRMDFNILYAILCQCDELGWDIYEKKGNE